MVLKFIILIFYISCIFTQQLIPMIPSRQCHLRSESLIVTCDARSLNYKNIDLTLFYEYNNENYTLSNIERPENDLIYGTLKNVKNNIVNVLCVDKKRSSLISNKIYNFGYSFKEIFSTGNSLNMSCKDYNFLTVECCLDPEISKIITETEFVFEKGANFYIELKNDNLTFEKSQSISSCFNKHILYTPQFDVEVVLGNSLNKEVYIFNFIRDDILKVHTPNLDIYATTPKSFNLTYDMIYHSTYNVLIKCSSYLPFNLIQEKEFNFTGSSGFFQFNKWPAYSLIECLVKVKFYINLPTTLSSSTISIHMPESIPAKSPSMFNMFIYQSMNRSDLINTTIYFSDLPVADRNGLITHYKVTCEGRCVFDSSKRTQILIGPNEVQISNMSRGVHLTNVKINTKLSIVACTSKGCSKMPSHIIIKPSYDNSSDGDLIIKQLTNNQYNISWRSDTNHSILGLCKYRINYPDDCVSIILMHIESQIGSIIINKSNRYLERFVLFTNNSTSKFQWNSCVYSTSTNTHIDNEISLDLLKQLFPVEIQVDCTFSLTNVIVAIKSLSCHQFNRFIIKRYIIKHNNHSYNYSMPTSSRSFQISNSIFFSGEFVILVETEDNLIYQLSIQSKRCNFNFIHFLICLLIMIVVIIICYYTFKYCWYKGKKYFDYKPKITRHFNNQSNYGNPILFNTQLKSEDNLKSVNKYYSISSYKKLAEKVSNSSDGVSNDQPTNSTFFTTDSTTSDSTTASSSNYMMDNQITGDYEEPPKPMHLDNQITGDYEEPPKPMHLESIHEINIPNFEPVYGYVARQNHFKSKHFSTVSKDVPDVQII